MYITSVIEKNIATLLLLFVSQVTVFHCFNVLENSEIFELK
jgi:hypothetical protein